MKRMMRTPINCFYLFGMGNRRKMLYKEGKLIDALSGQVIQEWKIISENIYPSEYRVVLELINGKTTIIWEDEVGVWVKENKKKTLLTEGHLRLPRFEENKYAPLLRILHHEILINIVNGKPLPNFFVYSKPWYRDAAMMCMCLNKTGNLHLVRRWILNLREPFDRNNSGICEPDNLGQALYMISLVSNASHPLVDAIRGIIPKFRKYNYITGLTDFREHPVYQTKWLKFGLRKLGLNDSFQIPRVFDDYSALFWMDYKEAHVPGPPFEEKVKKFYPYLAWAEAHFHGWPLPMEYSNTRYPLTWEAYASQAKYVGMALISQEYVSQKICMPHAWHAAEMFLYLLEQGSE